MTTYDDEELLDLLVAEGRDGRPIELRMDWQTCMVLVGALQVALRQPGFCNQGHLGSIVREVIDSIQRAAPPGMQELIRRGAS